MYWDKLTSPRIGSLDKRIPVVLPIAATEQHGTHLPLATDRMIGEHFCTVLNDRMKDHMLILPTVAIGCSEHHTDFPGTLTITHETMLGQLTDVASCVVQNGFQNLIVLNSHGGNQAIAASFQEIFGYRNRIRLVLATWWKIAGKALSGVIESGPGGTGHAGELETSLMLHIAPELVDMTKLGAKMNQSTFDWAEADMLDGPKASLYQTMKEKTPSGVFGDPLPATADKGTQIVQIVVDGLQQIVQDLFHSQG